MDDDGYPTEETLKLIREWDYHDVNGLAEFVVSIWHWGEPWAQLSVTRTDDFHKEYRELRLATGGWSGNESVIGALDANVMFNAICWYMSQRGGLHIYHVPPPFTK